MGFKEKYIKESWENEKRRTKAIEKAYELLLVPDMYNAIDGCFDNDALRYLREALPEYRMVEIEKDIIYFYGDEHLGECPDKSPF